MRSAISKKGMKGDTRWGGAWKLVHPVPVINLQKFGKATRTTCVLDSSGMSCGLIRLWHDWYSLLCTPWHRFPFQNVAWKKSTTSTLIVLIWKGDSKKDELQTCTTSIVLFTTSRYSSWSSSPLIHLFSLRFSRKNRQHFLWIACNMEVVYYSLQPGFLGNVAEQQYNFPSDFPMHTQRSFYYYLIPHHRRRSASTILTHCSNPDAKKWKSFTLNRLRQIDLNTAFNNAKWLWFFA